MKGYTKKIKAKRILATFLTALMVLTICMPQTVSAASADDRYTGGTTIADILTNYQYFIRYDAVLKNHTVGAVAVGDDLIAENTIGDGAQSPSYVEDINSATIGQGAGYGATTRDFYYNTWSAGGDATSAGFTQNGNFFANQGGISGIFGSTSSGLIAESISLATSATEVYTCNENSAMGFPTIDITLKEQNMNIEIPYEEFYKAKAIHLNISDIDNLSKYAYTINITGVNGTNVTMEGEAWGGNASTPQTDVFVNGKQSAFLGDLSGQVHGIECNLSGMKLIWNFPDATGTVNWSYMGGHVVAPQAHVEVTSGRFQGSIIANSFFGRGESHYYPYNAVSGAPQDMVITKKFVDVDGNPATVTSGSAVFGLYTDSACATTPLTTASVSAADIDATTGIGTVRFENVETVGVTNNSTYYIKEISAPAGFSMNKTVYECKVSDGGLITYCEYGKDANPIYSSASPICENLVDETTDATGVLIVIVEDKDTREKVENVQITVENEKGEVVKSYNDATTTNTEGIITFKGLEPGDYTVTIGTIPEGYQTPTEYKVDVEVKETSYHTFELEQVKEPITVKFVDTDGKPVEVGGWVTVQNTGDVDIHGAPVNEAMSAWITTGGTTTFKNNLSAKYTVSLMTDKDTGNYILPEGYILADKDLNGNSQNPTATIIVSATDGITDNSHTFVLEKQVGAVEVTVYEKDAGGNNTTNPIANATVEITYPDGTTEEKTTDNTGKLTYTEVPVGNVTVEIIGAPGYVIPTDGTEDEALTVTNGNTAKYTFYLQAIPEGEKGDLVITIKTPSDTSNTTIGVDVTVTNSKGETVGTYTDYKVNDTITLSDIDAGTYAVTLTDTPNENWKTDSSVTQLANVTKDTNGTAEYVLVPYGALDITVVETGSTTPVIGANVIVKNSDSVPIYTGKTTGTNILISDLPVGTYTVTATAPYNSNYQETSVTATPAPSVTVGNTTSATLELTPVRNLTVTVVDADNETIKIPGISVAVNTVKDGVTTAYSGANTKDNGSYIFEDVPVGTYEVKISSVPADCGYEIKNETGYNETTAIVTASQDGTAVLKLVKTATAEPTAKLHIKIVDTNGNVLDFATDPSVTITYPNATTETTAVTDGSMTKVDTAIGAYTVVLDKSTIPANYELDAGSAASQSATLAANGEETITFTLKEIPPAPTTGTLKVEVLDEDGNKVNFDVDVTATDKSNISNVTSISVVKGEATQTIEKGDYAVKIDTADIPSAYELDTSKSGNTINRSIVTGTTSTVTFYVKEKVVTPATGTLVIEILDSKDNSKVTFNVDTTIDNTLTSDTTSITVNNGTSAQVLNVGTYKVTLDGTDIETNNYELDTDKSSTLSVDNIIIADGGTETVTFYVKEQAAAPATATLNVQIVDKDGNVLDNLSTYPSVTVTYPDASSETKTVTDGKITIADTAIGDYSVVLDTSSIPDGYILKPECDKEQKSTLVANDNKTIKYVLLQTAKVIVKVTEDGTGDPIDSAKVEVVIGTNPDGTPNVVTGTTDSTGKVTLDLPIGDNKVEITDLPDGYEDPTASNPMEKDITVVPSATNNVSFTVATPVVAPTGTIEVTVKDKTTGDVLPGATMELQDGSGNAIKDASNNAVTAVSDGNGKVTFDNLPDGDYEVEVIAVPKTYKLPTATAGDDILTITSGNTVTTEHKVYGTGDIVITVYDKTNGKVVTNAEVTITGPADSGLNNTVMNTGATGTLTLKDQIVGGYVISANGVANYEIYGATNGSVTVSRGQQSEQKFEVVQTADVTVKVTEEAAPNNPVAGAEVTITDPYGNEKTGTTDANGLVTFEKQPVGEQQVTINKVPSSSATVLPEKTNEKVTISTSTPGNVEFKLPALDTSGSKGDLVITVVDDKTGAKVPGATVTVKDPQGNVVPNPQGGNEFTTDGDGKIELKDLTPVGTYSVIVNTVPSGYTQPSGDAMKVTVVAGQSTTLTVNIKKPVTGGVSSNNPPANNTTSNNSVTKAPKTGDISYIPVAVIMMILSALGFTGVMVYRKKTENAR